MVLISFIANFLIKRETTVYRSIDKIHWVYKEYKYPFVMSVDKRTGKNSQCLYCLGRKLLVGFNNFKTWCEKNDRFNLLNERDFSNVPSQYFKDNKTELVSWKCCRCSNRRVASILTRVKEYNNYENFEKTIKYKRGCVW